MIIRSEKKRPHSGHCGKYLIDPHYPATENVFSPFKIRCISLIFKMKILKVILKIYQKNSGS